MAPLHHRLIPARLGLFAAAALSILSGLAGPAQAQNVLTVPPPSNYTLDERGVDLVSGTLSYSATLATVGPQDQGGMAFTRSYVASEGYRDNLIGTLEIESTPIEGGGSYLTYSVSVGGMSDVFNENLIARERNGSTLAQSGAEWVYTAADGTVARFDSTKVTQWPGAAQANGGLVTTLTKPSGEQWTWHYRSAVVQVSSPQGMVPVTLWRVQSATNNLGYQLKAEYANNAPTGAGDIYGFTTRTRVWAINNAVDYCSPTADTCPTFTQAWQNVTISVSGATETVTDTIGRVTTSQFDGYGSLLQLQTPDPNRAPIVIGMSGGRVGTYSDGVGTWVYTFQEVIPGGGQEPVVADFTITDPNGLVTSGRTNIRTNRLQHIVRPGGRRTDLDWDQYNRLARVTEPEGNYTQFTRDLRNNVTEVRAHAKTGITAPDIVQTAAYPSSCTSTTLLTCNQPTSLTDARGAVTGFTYSTAHGGLLTMTRPAPQAGGVQAVTTNSYAQFTGQRKNASGVLTNETVQVWRPTTVQNCPTTATCPGAAVEVVSANGWGGSNVLLLTTTNRSGNSSLIATNTNTYDAFGNLLTVNGPLAGAADTIRNVYDGARRLVGVIGPDPDGAGARLFPAQRTTYDANDQVIAEARGTTTGQTDAAWAGFNPLTTSTTEYNAQGRRVRDVAASGTAAATVTEYAYDSGGRSTCTTRRMNPSVFGSLPAACALGTEGAFGPDRIVRNVYDASGRLASVISADGTPVARTETQTWTLNDEIATRADGNGNLSTYVYDGFDRISRLRYPNAAGGGSSTTDYEEYTYDPNGNPITKRTRGGYLFTTTFDALNRITRIDAPSPTLDSAFTYDNLDRRLTACWWSGVACSQTVTATWDALGRQTAETGAIGAVGYAYDQAGRRLSITWPDGARANYEYDLSNQVTAIKEGTGALTTLATYTYDNLGLRTTIARPANTLATSYGYDAGYRLASMGQDLNGSVTANDLGLTFTRNPASQLATRVSSNTAYTYTPALSATAYSNNGRNQVTAAGGATITYDVGVGGLSNGNIANDGTTTYAYDAANRLLGAGTKVYGYDPLDRLYEEQAGVTRRFLYAGDQLIGEYNTSGVIQVRYVPGPGGDEPLAEYAGAAITTPIFYAQDERGSVIARTSAAGLVGAINTYDDYGVPASTVTGRYQYTGQTRLTDTGLYYYKARVYAPSLGRFLQTDPVGYEAGLNLYAYVANDPVNLVDPTGAEISVSSTQAIVDGVRVTTVAIHYTAALQNDGATLPAGETLENIASTLEASIAADFSKTFVDADGSVTQYVTTADIVVGAPMGSQHSITFVAAGDSRVGANVGMGETPGQNMWLSDLLFDPAAQALGASLSRTGPHEFGHNAGLNHTSGENLMTVTQDSRSHNITRDQLRQIYRNPSHRR